jgi:hypothetical protein
MNERRVGAMGRSGGMAKWGGGGGGGGGHLLICSNFDLSLALR